VFVGIMLFQFPSAYHSVDTGLYTTVLRLPFQS
jgi:hypothetical protein